MKTTIFLLVIAAACAFRYVLQFTGATLALGRVLADSQSGTGFQDAITPPIFTKIAISTYLCTLILLGTAFATLGPTFGLLSIAVFSLVAFCAGFFMPRVNSKHFVHQIFRSMSNRYADYVRDGDPPRADAMRQLLEKAAVQL